MQKRILTEEQREERNRYQREWRKRNPDKCKKYARKKYLKYLKNKNKEAYIKNKPQRLVSIRECNRKKIDSENKKKIYLIPNYEKNCMILSRTPSPQPLKIDKIQIKLLNKKW